MCLPEAKGSILCDEKTYQLCQSDTAFKALGKATVKGKAEPISIYRPLKPKNDRAGKFATMHKGAHPIIDEDAELIVPRPPKKTILIGRTKERNAVKELLEKHISGESVSLVMEGNAGSGVSTIVKFLRDEANGRGAYTWYIPIRRIID